ncbi:hypothetical protein BJ944DRAFT_234419, partial [Cunninghamella echinulata]
KVDAKETIKKIKGKLTMSKKKKERKKDLKLHSVQQEFFFSLSHYIALFKVQFQIIIIFINIKNEIMGLVTFLKNIATTITITFTAISISGTSCGNDMISILAKKLYVVVPLKIFVLMKVTWLKVQIHSQKI